MNDYTVTVDSDGVEWAWKVVTERWTLPGVSRRITDVESDARSAIIAAHPERRFTGFTVGVEFARPYVLKPGLPRAIICDIDGTLALHNSRGPFDFDKVETDDVNEPVALALTYLSDIGDVILLSGRQEEYRPHTERWLANHQVFYNNLFMRPEGDRRSDDVVKLDLFDKYVRDNYLPWLVLDDRDRCVYLWRKLGLACWQVNFGDF